MTIGEGEITVGTKLRDAIYEEVHTSCKRVGLYSEGKSERDKADELVDNLEHRMLGIINDLTNEKVYVQVEKAKQMASHQRQSDITKINELEETIARIGKFSDEKQERNRKLHDQIKVKDQLLGKLRGQLSKGATSPVVLERMEEEISFLRNVILSNTTHGEPNNY